MKETCLMFDRHWIANYSEERRARGECRFAVCPPQKPGGPFMTADKPWESMTLNLLSVIYENNIFRAWYEAVDQNYENDAQSTMLCYAESRDGVCWEKPCLGLFEYGGNRDNNIVFSGAMTSGQGFSGSCVFLDPQADPRARYRLSFTGFSFNKSVHENSMGFAYSADGIHWTSGIPEPHSWLEPPMAPFGSDTQSAISWDPWRKKYVGFFRRWEPGYTRTVGRAETSDLRCWPYPETVLALDENDPFGCDIYTSGFSYYRSGTDEAYFLFFAVFNHMLDTVDVQLATSRDGIRFKRLDRTPFVSNTDGLDNNRCIYMSPGIHIMGDDVVLTYMGTEYRHGEATPDQIRYAGNYTLLRFPKDRFQGLYTDSRFEFSLRKALPNNGRPPEVNLNAKVGEGGSIRAGLLRRKAEKAIYDPWCEDPVYKEGERPAMEYLEGFSPEDCVPVTGDGVRLRIVWENKNAAWDDAAQALELRIILEKSVLFSISF